VSDSVVLDVKVVPRAGRTQLAGMRGGLLLVRLAAAPVDGAANAELVTFLAGLLNIPNRQIAIVSGEKSRRKRLRISGVAQEAIDKLFRQS